MIDVEAVSPKQRVVLNHGNTGDFMMVSGGSIRSGKTYATLIGFGLWSIDQFPGRRFILAGQSVEAVRRNYAEDLVNLFNMFGFEAKLILSHGSRIEVPINGMRSTYHIVGANDERAAPRLQGMTAAGGILDEVVLLPQSFFNQVVARISVQGSKLWATYNPANPGHWFKREVVDKAARHKARLLQFGLDDNPALSDEVKERYRASFSGHYKARLVEGKWAAPSGVIFPRYDTVPHSVGYVRNEISIDWGVSNVFAALMFGRDPQRRLICHDELYHDARQDISLSEDQTLAKLLEWIRPRSVRVCFVDPSMPVSFKRKLRGAGMTVRNADNDVDAGLMVTQARLDRAAVLISERCENLLREMEGYVWDEQKSDQGEDAPVKSADHACDALRYYVHTTGKIGQLAEGLRKPEGM